VESILYPNPPPSVRLYHAWAPTHIGEYVQTISALIPNTFVAPFNETTKVFHFLHPLVEVNFPPFIDDFHFEMEVTLDRETFISTLVRSPRLSSNDPSNMVYELL
jgi:hypothetical protein